ncbi:nif-specific transcriptional activator NifA [Omnitrophica bacterium]|nr:nif-specific transcriptional activator NifA [Candidatus Omnitrophota bacterium]
MSEDKTPESVQGLKREIVELSVLYEISAALNASSDLEHVLSETLRILHEKMGMERGTLTLLEERTGELIVEIAHKLGKEQIQQGRYQLGEGIVGKVVQAGEPIVVPNVGEEPMFLDKTKSRGDLKKSNISFICVPIKIDGKSFGALSVDRLFQENISFEEDVRLLTSLAAMVAQTVHNYQARKQEREQLEGENIELKRKLKKKFHPANIIGESGRMQDVYASVELVSQTKASVLLRGESGTGKELVAHAIHYNSDRAEKPFIKVSCAALPDTLLESELFGYEKGAFTGATAGKAGRFELANQGTLFLDEIGDIPASTQVKLLRVLQEREFERLGGMKPVIVDIRLITATNKNLEEEVKAGRFREDLYYRLNVIPIFIPALRDKKSDIPLLVNYFLKKSSDENGKDVRYVSDEAMSYLMGYSWPGNVRELENAIERAVVLCKKNTITPDLFPIPGSKLQPAHMTVLEAKDSLAGGQDENSGSLTDAVAAMEKKMIQNALRKTAGNQRKAAKVLGVTERILGYKIKNYNINTKL